MKKKNILLVSSSFHPENSPRSFRATELAKELSRQGHDVKVISKFRPYNYTEFLKQYPINFQMWEKPKFPRIPSFKIKPLVILSKGIKRVLSLLFEYPIIEEMFSVKWSLKNESGYDLMISFAVPYPVHWGVAWVRTKKNPIAKHWVADCGDPYMFARLDSFRKPFYFKYLELNFCRKCDTIAVPFEKMKNQFYPQFMSKMKVIPQGFKFDEISLYDGPKINREYPVFIFAGSILPGKRDLKLLFDLLISENQNFRFIIYTNQKDWFSPYINILGEKLVLNNYIDRLSLIYEMSKVDFLINVDTSLDTEANVEAVPSKLIDYALSKRPILNINSLSIDKSKVLKFMDGDYSGQRIIEISNYKIDLVASKFIELANDGNQ